VTAIRVLGRFEPAEYTSDTIEQGVRALACLPPCCRRERISVRVPQPDAEAPHPNNLEWHQDGGGAEGTTQHMVIWASEQPTELRDADGTLFAAQPGELVWFDNTVAWHRQPRGTDETRRWFVAIRCSGAV
jgi:hypothetical protein